MAGALEAAKTGYDVTIVEKENVLGGQAVINRKHWPLSEPYDKLTSPMVNDLVHEVEAHPNITVKTETVVARIAGQPGEFTVTLKKPGEKIPFDVPFPVPEEMKFDETVRNWMSSRFRKFITRLMKEGKIS